MSDPRNGPPPGIDPVMMMEIQLERRMRLEARMRQQAMARERMEIMMLIDEQRRIEEQNIMMMELRRRQNIAAQMYAVGLEPGLPSPPFEVTPHMGMRVPSMGGPRPPRSMDGVPFDLRCGPPTGFHGDHSYQRDGSGEPQIVYGDWEVEEMDDNDKK